MFPPGAGQGRSALTIEIEMAEPFTARSLMLHPAAVAFAAQCELQAADEAGTFRLHPILYAGPLEHSSQCRADAARAGRGFFSAGLPRNDSD